MRAGGAPRSLWPWLAKALPKVQGGRADPVQALTPPQGPLASQIFSVYSDQREPCVPLVCVHHVFYSSVGGAVGRVLADRWGLRASEILAGDRGHSPTRTELAPLPAFKASFLACPSPPNLLCSSRARLVGRGTGEHSLPPKGMTEGRRRERPGQLGGTGESVCVRGAYPRGQALPAAGCVTVNKWLHVSEPVSPSRLTMLPEQDLEAS